MLSFLITTLYSVREAASGLQTTWLYICPIHVLETCNSRGNILLGSRGLHIPNEVPCLPLFHTICKIVLLLHNNNHMQTSVRSLFCIPAIVAFVMYHSSCAHYIHLTQCWFRFLWWNESDTFVVFPTMAPWAIKNCHFFTSSGTVFLMCSILSSKHLRISKFPPQ